MRSECCMRFKTWSSIQLLTIFFSQFVQYFSYFQFIPMYTFRYFFLHQFEECTSCNCISYMRFSTTFHFNIIFVRFHINYWRVIPISTILCYP
uniref:Putative secreted protein n=1 Tax=Panstrongylus lignarius TaxID=156445 RepID=A0A224XRG9_9HEMI